MPQSKGTDDDRDKTKAAAAQNGTYPGHPALE